MILNIFLEDNQMKPISNYHTHIYLCKHATGTVRDYVEKAISLDYQVIGISDHGPINEELKKQFYTRRMDMKEYQNIYLKDLVQLKEEYRDKITLLGALEIEFFDEMVTHYPKFINELDYLILGQHYLKVDGKYTSVYRGMTPKNIKIYTDTVLKAFASGYFKILAHPEIFTMSYPKWDEHCEQATQRIIEGAKKYNIILEVNANGMRLNRAALTKDNKFTNSYPHLNFWQSVAKTDLPVIVNDDAHAVEHLCDQATFKAYDFARELGLNIIQKIQL